MGLRPTKTNEERVTAPTVKGGGCHVLQGSGFGRALGSARAPTYALCLRLSRLKKLPRFGSSGGVDVKPASFRTNVT